MLDFTFLSPTKIIFGRGVEKGVGTELALQAKKVLVHYGGQSVIRSGLLERVKDSLSAAGLSFVLLGVVKPNPRVSLIREGIKLCKQENIDFILAVGGGSVIDSAKAIGIGSCGA